MSGEIKAGDMVMVAYGVPCCGGGTQFGYTFTVANIAVEHSRFGCAHCGAIAYSLHVAFEAGDRAGFMLDRLIKLDPLSEPESVETREELPA